MLPRGGAFCKGSKKCGRAECEDALADPAAQMFLAPLHKSWSWEAMFSCPSGFSGPWAICPQPAFGAGSVQTPQSPRGWCGELPSLWYTRQRCGCHQPGWFWFISLRPYPFAAGRGLQWDVKDEFSPLAPNGELCVSPRPWLLQVHGQNWCAPMGDNGNWEPSCPWCLGKSSLGHVTPFSRSFWGGKNNNNYNNKIVSSTEMSTTFLSVSPFLAVLCFTLCIDKPFLPQSRADSAA